MRRWYDANPAFSYFGPRLPGLGSFAGCERAHGRLPTPSRGFEALGYEFWSFAKEGPESGASTRTDITSGVLARQFRLCGSGCAKDRCCVRPMWRVHSTGWVLRAGRCQRAGLCRALRTGRARGSECEAECAGQGGHLAAILGVWRQSADHRYLVRAAQGEVVKRS